MEKKRDSTDLYLIFGTSERDEGLVFLQGKQKNVEKGRGIHTLK